MLKVRKNMKTDRSNSIDLEMSSFTVDTNFKETKTYFGIELKPGYTLKNLWAMPLCIVAATVAGTYTNTEIIFLLKDKNYFNIPDDEIGIKSSALIFYSIPISMVSTFIIG